MSSTTGNVVHFELVGHILAQVGVLVTGEDGIVRLEIVLLQELLIHIGTDIQQGISDTENIAFAAKINRKIHRIK